MFRTCLAMLFACLGGSLVPGPCWHSKKILVNPLRNLPTRNTRPFRVRGTHFVVPAWLGLWLLLCWSVPAAGQVNVYTRSYDTSRTGANLQETILTPA